MSRPKQPRSIGAEANVARLVGELRQSRGLSLSTLARLMTEAGCPIQPTALLRIEKGQPRRTISVDELVAFSRVFGISVDVLLDPDVKVEVRLTRGDAS